MRDWQVRTPFAVAHLRGSRAASRDPRIKPAQAQLAALAKEPYGLDMPPVQLDVLLAADRPVVLSAGRRRGGALNYGAAGWRYRT